MSSSTGGADFYNKVAKKFGGYKTSAKYHSEYPTGNPEEVFKAKLLELANHNSTVLDIGCADGRFTLSLAQNFKKIIAVDFSDGMLNSAKKNQKEQGVINVSFEKQDASGMPYADNSFDLIYSRRGPTYYKEFFRLLKNGARYVEIQIGEQDAKSIKEVFGRGQDFGKWDTAKIQENTKEIESVGLKVIFAQDYVYDEYYETPEDLQNFLEGVPIFEDFDPKKDKEFLNQYISLYTTNKGILLSRHRVVIAAEK